MQNLIQLFALRDLSEQMGACLQDETFRVRYQSDVNWETPLRLAKERQSDGAYQAIIKAFEYCEQLFLTPEDLLLLAAEANPIVNLALDRLFKPAEFLDMEGHITRGNMRRGALDMLFGGGADQQVIFFDSRSRYLNFNTVIIESQRAEPRQLEAGVQQLSIDTSTASTQKVEYLTLQFKANF